MTTRSEAAANGWGDANVRERRRDRVAVEVAQIHALSLGEFETFASVPKAFRHLQLTNHAEPLKDATAKAVRLIIAQGGQVRIKGYHFRRKEQ